MRKRVTDPFAPLPPPPPRVGRPPASDAETVRRACERRAGGESLTDLAKAFGVSTTTIARWSRGYQPPPPKPIPQGMLESAPVPSAAERSQIANDLGFLAIDLDSAGRTTQARLVRRAIDALGDTTEAEIEMPDPSTDTRGWIVAMIGRVQRSYEDAERAHNSSAARQYSAVLEKWSKTLSQYDRQHASDAAVVIPIAEIETRRAALLAQIKILTSEPPRCVDCGRSIRVAWVEEATS